MSTLPHRITRLFALPLLLLAAGCGSILSTSEISAANEALELAMMDDADELAIYEFVSAETYLQKAREEWGRSDFQQAVDYARRARAFAVRASERARREATMTANPTETDED